GGARARRREHRGRRNRVHDRFTGRAALLLRHQRALQLRRRCAERDRLRSLRAFRRLSREGSGVGRPRCEGGRLMRFGFWLPVFGGWLRNVEDEGMAASWDYVSRLARRSEEIGFDLTLVAELNLNDIKGEDAPSLDA